MVTTLRVLLPSDPRSSALLRIGIGLQETLQELPHVNITPSRIAPAAYFDIVSILVIGPQVTPGLRIFILTCRLLSAGDYYPVFP